jgi:hypothetical protein
MPQAMTLELMASHGLGDWTFAFSKRKRILGLCRHSNASAPCGSGKVAIGWLVSTRKNAMPTCSSPPPPPPVLTPIRLGAGLLLALVLGLLIWVGNQNHPEERRRKSPAAEKMTMPELRGKLMGATPDEVRALLGAPDQITAGEAMQTWYHREAISAATVVVTLDEGRVVRVDFQDRR